jgi:O-antigen/teichoic acid export membrane protein
MSADATQGASPQSSLKRNSMVNLLGALAPMAVSLLTLPPYLRVIGDVRFGVLTLVWIFFGYFLFFDLGLGRAMAHHVAKARDESDTRKLFWTGVLLNGSLGLLGGALLWLCSALLIGTVIKVPPEYLGEVRGALPWLALAMPLATAGSVLNGCLEGRERFVTLNLLGVIGAVLSQLAPLAIAIAYGPGLGGLIAAVTAVRVLSTVLAALACRRSLPPLGLPTFDRETARQLLGFGGWITVSGMINPILTTLDRLMIGALAGAQALTHYSVPFSLISRAQVIPSSVASTLFPRFSQQDRQAAGIGAHKAILVLASLMTPLVVIGMLLLKPFLQLWVGHELAAAAGPIGAVLMLGIWVNSIAWIPFTLLQGLGRPDVTAKIHALEVLPYLATLAIGLALAGPLGAAWAWSLRVAADMGLLYRAAKLPASLLGVIAPAPGLVLAAWLCTLLRDGPAHATAGVCLALVSLSWSWHVAPEELRGLVVKLSSRLRFA